MNTTALGKETVSLPIKESDFMDDSFEPSEAEMDPNIEAAWMGEAQRRLAELRSGAVQGIPGEHVFHEIRQHLT